MLDPNEMKKPDGDQLSFHLVGGAEVCHWGYTCSDERAVASDACRVLVIRALLLEHVVGDALLRICPGSQD